jgi:Icc protein
MRRVIRLAHLSDTHLVADPAGLVAGYDSRANLEAVLEAFPARPDVAVVTGDVAEDGSADAYHGARDVISCLTDEVHYVSGNHDDPSTMKAVLDAGDELRVVPLSPQWSVALLSSTWPGHGAGCVDPDTLERLRDALARATTNVLVCVHHPPLSTCGYPYCRTENSSEVMQVLTTSPQIRGVLSGHLHRRFDVPYRGIRFLGAPSTCRQLKHWRTPTHFASTPAPPAASLLQLHDDGSVVNRYVFADRRQPRAYRRLLSQTWQQLASR